MLAILRSKAIALLGTSVLLAACSDGASKLAGPVPDSDLAMSAGAYHQSAMVNWHAQQLGFGRSGVVAGASATLVRNATGNTSMAAAASSRNRPARAIRPRYGRRKGSSPDSDCGERAGSAGGGIAAV